MRYLATIYSQQKAVNRQMLQDSLDWMLPGNTLGFVNLNEGALGLIGYVGPAVTTAILTPGMQIRHLDHGPAKSSRQCFGRQSEERLIIGHLGLCYVVQYQVVLSVYSTLLWRSVQRN